jgi:hypothetical protein
MVLGTQFNLGTRVDLWIDYASNGRVLSFGVLSMDADTVAPAFWCCSDEQAWFFREAEDLSPDPTSPLNPLCEILDIALSH